MSILKSERKAKRFINDLESVILVILSIIIAMTLYLVVTGRMEVPTGPMLNISDIKTIYNNGTGVIYGR